MIVESSEITRNIKDEISTGLNKTQLLQATANHPPTVKALPTTKITKLGLLPFPPMLFKRRFTISELKSKSIFSTPGKQSWTAKLEFGLANH